MSTQPAISILLTSKFPTVASELLTNAGFTITSWEEERPMTSTELLEQAASHNALLCTLTDSIDSQFLNQCSHLDIISQFAVGYDNIDVTEATKLGIPIGFTPNAMNDATADIAFGLMIATARKMFYSHKTIITGDWGFFKPTANLGIELKGKTLGIYGLGRIGLEMARRCKGAYQMKVIYHNRRHNQMAEQELNANKVSFGELLARSDVLSVHCSLTDETRGIFNKSVFDQMKQNSIFINTSRGSVHNEKDLIAALDAGQIWGAGLDVTNPEPMKPDNPLLSMANVSILPHIGSATVEARDEMARLAAENIIEFYKHNAVPFIVNAEVLVEKGTS